MVEVEEDENASLRMFVHALFIDRMDQDVAAAEYRQGVESKKEVLCFGGGDLSNVTQEIHRDRN
ncbi:hypothetical protein E4U40_000778 [Claviceps sp. LM458 group G5]|nr:hypothetical protein E4U40_000778 [Claviceps sp. LM458 group G5]